MVLFTTGRGTPFGGVVPTLKISTNSDLYNNKKHWIDFNAGQILENKDARKVDEEFFNLIVNTASGKKSIAELWAIQSDSNDQYFYRVC